MAASHLKLDDYPIIHAAHVYSSDGVVIFEDREFESIAKKIKKIEGHTLSSIIKECSKKPLRTQQTFQINDDEVYELYVLYGSSDDKVVFLVDGNTEFTKQFPLKQEKENALLILPFLDASLLRFLERREIYGNNVIPQTNARKRPSASSRSLRMMQMKESFSLEEVFRELDADGNGHIDLEEFQHGLSQMMASSTITDDDLELVFQAISSNGTDISWRQFYNFFDGKNLMRSTQKLHKMTLSTQLNINMLPDMAKSGLGTLNEDEQTKVTASDLSNIMINSTDDNDEKNSNSNSKQIQKVKQSIRECLNLGEDTALLSPVPTSAYSSPHPHSSAAVPVNTDDVDVAMSLLRIENAEDLMELMEHNIFLVPDTQTMTKWENRYQSHKLRINNFRKILNGILGYTIISMRDENTTLREQLENIRGDDMQELAQLHNQQFPSLKLKKTYSKKQDQFDDDSSSIDSEVNLVYTKGTKLSTKESESLMNRVKVQKKAVKKLQKENKKLKEAHKLELIKMKRLIDSQNTKIKSYEKARKSMVEQQQKIQKQLREVRGVKQHKRRSSSIKTDSAANQREISLLKKQLRNVQNELEAEQERKRNLQKKLARVISAANKESGKGNGSNTVSHNKLKRLEKERDKLHSECDAKTKKMDEMFLKLGAMERKHNLMTTENAELKAKLGSYTTQIREINRRTTELQSITDERDRAFAEIDDLEKHITKCNEKVAKLKSRNRKLKERIKRLLCTIEELDALALRSKNAITDLLSMQRELTMVETEAKNYQNANDTLNTKIAELRASIKMKKNELESTTVKLEKFREDLSTEYNMIKSLEEQIEEKDNVLTDLEKQNLSERDVFEAEREELSIALIRSEAQIETSQKVIARYKEKTEKYQLEIETVNEKLLDYEQNERIKLRSDISDLEGLLSTKTAEIELLKGKNAEIIESLNMKRDVSDKIKEKNDEIDDLMNNIESLQTRVSQHQDKYANKCNECDALSAKLKKLEKERQESATKIGKLNIQMQKKETKKMQQEDDVKLKLKKYEVQIVRIEENKKLIEKLRQDIGEYKTKWQLEVEAVKRHKKAMKQFEEESDDKTKTIKSQKKKIKSLQKELDTSGFGDSKQKSTLSLLRQNVDAMESIIRTKDFDIKKLRNNLRAIGSGQNHNENKENKELKEKIQTVNENANKLKTKIKKQSDELKANKELLNTKNTQLTQLKSEISELHEYQQKMIDEQKENEVLNKQVSVMKNQNNQNIEQLNDEIHELRQKLNKVGTEKQRKIDSLEAELADKDSVLMNIGKQVGTELIDD